MVFRCAAMIHEDEQHRICMYWVEGMWQQKYNNIKGPDHMRICKTLEAAVG